MRGSDGGGKILKPHFSPFQGILAPNKMQLFVCLACLDHFASKKSVCDLGHRGGGVVGTQQWEGSSVFMVATTELKDPM